jgi:hypothetical protein
MVKTKREESTATFAEQGTQCQVRLASGQTFWWSWEAGTWRLHHRAL